MANEKPLSHYQLYAGIGPTSQRFIVPLKLSCSKNHSVSCIDPKIPDLSTLKQQLSLLSRGGNPAEYLLECSRAVRYYRQLL